MKSPYEKKDVCHWRSITEALVRKHPLSPVIVDLCLKSWQSILNGKINTFLNMRIREMSISPQATGALLHDVIPEYIARNIPGFRKGVGKEKDIVCEANDDFSLELKTSSQKSIFGNRSYAVSDLGKSKAGYYLAINFEKIASQNPRILRIQLGWLDHSDWIAQRSETGQQASLTLNARNYKFATLYKCEDRSNAIQNDHRDFSRSGDPVVPREGAAGGAAAGDVPGGGVRLVPFGKNVPAGVAESNGRADEHVPPGVVREGSEAALHPLPGRRERGAESRPA